MRTKLPEINTQLSQFRKAYTELEDGSLNPTQYVLLNYAYDLMKMSWKNNEFYDKKYNDYYCICTQDNIRQKWNISESTITRTFQSLEKLGFIVRKKAKSGAMKIFCPHLSFVKKSPIFKLTSAQSSKWANNQRYFIKSDFKYTGETSSVSSSENNSNIVIKFNNNADNQQNHSEGKHNDFKKQTKLLALKKGLLNCHIPAKAISYAFRFYSSYKVLHDKIFATLFKAKKNAKRHANKDLNTYDDIKFGGGFVGDKKAVQDSFSFENNKIMNELLPEALRRILFKAEHESKKHKFCNYLYASFYDFFLKASKKHVSKAASEIEDDIPIFKIG